MNIFATSESEKKKRKNFKCIHRHHGWIGGHPNCYDQANNITEKIAYFDIESTNLKSSFGIVLCYFLLGQDNKLHKRIITPEELRSGVFDKPLLGQLCKDLRNYQRIITWNGHWFDLPFVRSRCDLYSLDFPVFKEIYHTDGLLLARRIYATLHSKRLGEVCKFFGIKAKEYPLNPDIWLRCLCGNKEALSYVGDKHCYEDVVALKKLWENKMEKYTKYTKTSI